MKDIEVEEERTQFENLFNVWQESIKNASADSEIGKAVSEAKQDITELYKSLGIDEFIRREAIITALYNLAVNSKLITHLSDESKERLQRFEVSTLIEDTLSKEKLTIEDLDSMIKRDVITQANGTPIIFEGTQLYKLWIKALQTDGGIRHVRRSKTATQTNSKVFNMLLGKTDEILDIKEKGLIVGGSQEDGTYIGEVATITTNVDEEIAKVFGEFTGAVYDAIGQCYDECRGDNLYLIPRVSYQKLYEAITHGKGKISPDMVKLIDKHVTVLLSTIVDMDYVESATRHKMPLIEGRYRITKTPMVVGKVGIDTETGMPYLEIMDRPALYQHAKDTKTMLFVDDDFFVIKVNGEVLRDNVPRICLKRFMFRRISQRKTAIEKARKELLDYQKRQGNNPKLKLPDKTLEEHIPTKDKGNDIISMDTLFKTCNVTSSDAKAGLRKYLVQALDYWKQEKYIVDYKLLSKEKAFKPKVGATFDSIQLIVGIKPEKEVEE